MSNYCRPVIIAQEHPRQTAKEITYQITLFFKIFSIYHNIIGFIGQNDFKR